MNAHVIKNVLNGTENHVSLFRIDYIISFKNAIADVLCMVTIVSSGHMAKSRTIYMDYVCRQYTYLLTSSTERHNVII